MITTNSHPAGPTAAAYALAWARLLWRLVRMIVAGTVIGPGMVLILVAGLWSGWSFDGLSWQVLQQAKQIQDAPSAAPGFLTLPSCDAPKPQLLPRSGETMSVAAPADWLQLCSRDGERPVMLVKAAWAAAGDLASAYEAAAFICLLLASIPAWPPVPRWRAPAAAAASNPEPSSPEAP